MPTENLSYALNIYCTPEDFADYHAETGEDCNYWEMRAETDDQYFHGNASFTHQDVVSANSETDGSHAGGHFDGGHHFYGGHH